MINTKLPVQKKTIDEESNKLIVEKGEINVAIDTSIYAEERWEANFPQNAKKETLFAYIERVKKVGQLESKAHILSNLKALYCFMEGQDIADFKSFLQLFDLADTNYIKKLVDKMKYVFELVLSTSAVDSKN